MTDDPRPIAWAALEEGTPVLASDGEQIGKVQTVVADVQKDIFSGLAVNAGLFANTRFVPADLIEQLTREAVHLTIPATQADSLAPYEG